MPNPPRFNSARRLPSLPLWEAYWSQSALRAKKSDDERTFARGFMMQAYSDEERMFPSFKSCYTHGVITGDIARRGYPVFVGVDLAGDKRPGNCIFVAAVDPVTHRRYPLEIHCGAWTSPETAGRLADVNARHNVKYIIVENNAYQQALIDWIRHSAKENTFWMKLEPFTTGRQKADPKYGLPSLEIEYRNKAWVVPADEFMGHDSSCRCGWCVWTRETADYPFSVTTDTVMATWFCREAIDRYGVSKQGIVRTGMDVNAR